MKRLCMVVCCFVVWASFVPTASAASKNWQIVFKGEEKGRNEHTAVNAATELAKYMSAVLNQRVRVVGWKKAKAPNIFYVTEAKYAPADVAALLRGKRGDAFVIKYPYMLNGKKVCLLVSHDKKGYDYPVYYFLNRFMGVDWVGPGEIGKVIPKNPGWKMPEQIDILENPDFEMRHWGDFKFNHARTLLAGSPRMGFHHALGNIFSPEKYGKSDPDIYPLIEGKRYIPDWKAAGYHATTGWQPCVGNPKSLDMATRFVVDQFVKDSSTVSVSLSINDGDSNHCTCKLCFAMDAKDAFKDPLSPNRSDRYFRFYNKVIERVLKKVPNAHVAVLGYGPCGTPPTETKIHERVCVFISTGANPRQFAAAGGASSLYHYHLDNAYPTIRHYPHTIAKYLRESKKAGGMGYYAQIEHSWAAGGPKTYVLAHLLWNVNSDVDALLDQYMRRAFGEGGAASMRAYFDRWEAIWQREAAVLDNPYDTIYGWNGDHIRKFRFMNWEDVHYLDAAMDIASKAKMTPRQKERLAFFNTYYKWIRCSIVQYLMAQDFQNPKWVAAKSSAEVLAAIGKCQALTTQFDKIWDESISKDRTGWLLNQKYGVVKAVARGERFYDSLCVEPIRAEIDAHFGKGVSLAFEVISANVKGGKPRAVAFWKKEFEKQPELRPFIKPELNRLQGIKMKNLLVNGNFEKGTSGTLEPGNPPRLPGWWFYDRVGQVLGSKATYDWSKKAGRNGGYAIGFGPGKYPGIRSFTKAEAGRYRFSFWYRTVNRQVPVEVNIFQLSNDVEVETLTSAKKVRALKNEQYLKFLRRSWPPTGGKWQHVTQTFTLEKASGIVIPIEPFYMKPGSWVWFDDVELVKLY
jgi:Domain of unknown function (DUF4838)